MAFHWTCLLDCKCAPPTRVYFYYLEVIKHDICCGSSWPVCFTNNIVIIKSSAGHAGGGDKRNVYCAGPFHSWTDGWPSISHPRDNTNSLTFRRWMVTRAIDRPSIDFQCWDTNMYVQCCFLQEPPLHGWKWMIDIDPFFLLIVSQIRWMDSLSIAVFFDWTKNSFHFSTPSQLEQLWMSPESSRNGDWSWCQIFSLISPLKHWETLIGGFNLGFT